jgi:hypothetical protein
LIKIESPPPPEPEPEPVPIEIRPFGPGMLCMTFPAGLIMPERQARKLLLDLHDALDQLRVLDAEHQKVTQAERKGIVSRKRRA